MNSAELFLRERHVIMLSDNSYLIKKYFLLIFPLLICSFTSKNVGLLIVGLIIPGLLLGLLWRDGEPQVLFFSAMYQWLQIFAPIASASILGNILGSEDGLENEMQYVAWLSLLGILVLSIGMHLSVRNWVKLLPNVNVVGSIKDLSVRKLFYAYVLVTLLTIGINYLTEIIPSIAQFFLALIPIFSVIIFLIFWGAVRDKKFRKLAVMVFILELLSGIGGFFGGFKAIFFIFGVIYFSRPRNLNQKIRPLLILLFALLIALGVVWQTIKADYRNFINLGSNSQKVLVSTEDRILFMKSSIQNLTFDDISAGFESLVERVGYLNFFALTTQTVPNFIPYQNGKLWAEALTHVITPRFLFPNKKEINDSDRTNEYSGIIVADALDGASIGIGYMGESYIDFGPIFMFVPIFLLGLFWGWCYLWFIRISTPNLLGLAVSTTCILIGAASFESSNIKFFGGAIAQLIVITPILKRYSLLIWESLCISKNINSVNQKF